MKKALLATGVGVAAGVGFFIPVSREASLPFVAPAPEPVRVLFVGDIMLDRNVARSAESTGVQYLFASTSELFAGADVRVANLEGTITDNLSLSRRDNTILRFTFSSTTAQETLDFLNITAVSLANNHALDFGGGGYAQTLEYLGRIGVAPFGHPLNDAARLSTVVESKGKTLCFVGYHSLFDPDRQPVEQEVERLRPLCWKVVVFAHWGEEYEGHSNVAQEVDGRAFVDAGADLVIGAHPHVVQNVEVYKNKAIFYSLGNFMFDQNFSWATTHGLAVMVEFNETQTRFLLTPTTVQGQKAGLAEGADRQKILDSTGILPGGGQVADFTLP